MMDEKCQFFEDICGMSDEMFEIIYLSFLSISEILLNKDDSVFLLFNYKLLIS